MRHEVIKRKMERDDAEGMNSNASKAIRGEKRDGVKRSGAALPDISVRKLIRTKGESRGEINREVITRRPVFDPQGMTDDAVDNVEWDK